MNSHMTYLNWIPKSLIMTKLCLCQRVRCSAVTAVGAAGDPEKAPAQSP